MSSLGENLYTRRFWFFKIEIAFSYLTLSYNFRESPRFSTFPFFTSTDADLASPPRSLRFFFPPHLISSVEYPLCGEMRRWPKPHLWCRQLTELEMGTKSSDVSPWKLPTPCSILEQPYTLDLCQETKSRAVWVATLLVPQSGWQK